MHIDWFVFAAQIVNFLILVALLKYFLYDKIVKAMDARQAAVASRLEEAERLREEAGRLKAQLEEESQDIKAKAVEILNQAQKEAEEHKARLMAAAEEEAQQSRQRWRETLARERQAFFDELRLKAGSFIFTTIRVILKEMAGKDLEERMVDVFVEKLRHLDPSQQDLLRRSLDSGPRELVVMSAFEMTPENQKKILDAVTPYLSDDVTLRCEVSASVVAGIELLSHGHRIAWSLGGHLAELEESFRNALREEIPEAGMDAGEQGTTVA